MSEQAQGWVGELAERYGGMVFAVAYRIVGNAEDAEDAMQEVFVKLLRLGGPSGGARDWGAYLKTMATTAALDVLRRRRGRTALPVEWIEQMPGPEGHGPRETAERRQMAQLLRGMLARLPQREATVFGLRYFEDLSYEAIADQTGINAGQVGVILHRTRRKLLELLKPLMPASRGKERDDARAPSG
jgi:RNA polymerase sigma-70 factor (ECF subfamily)